MNQADNGMVGNGSGEGQDISRSALGFHWLPDTLTFQAEREAAVNLGWEQPIPLRGSNTKAERYPLDYLPDMIRFAVEEVAETTQAPIPLIAASALTSVATCVQALVSVRRDKALVGSTGLYFMSIGHSGERKTTSDNHFIKPIRAWELRQEEEWKPKQAEYKGAMKAWKAVDAALQESIRKAAKSGQEIDYSDPKWAKHELNLPRAPRRPELIRQDDTPEALAVALSKWPVASIISNEAGVIFGSHGMNPEAVTRNLAQLNIFWDGERLKRTRTTQESVDIEGMRVSMGLQVQREVLNNFMGKNGELARGVGLFARFLLAEPESTMGTRLYREPKLGRPRLEAFLARIWELLSCPINVDKDGRLSTHELEFDAKAKERWVDYYNEVEKQLGYGGGYYDIRDVASKSAENVARLAANFQVFASGGESIGVDHTEEACVVGQWYLDEALRFFGEAAVPPDVRKAMLLEEYLKDQLGQHRKRFVPANDVVKYGPNALRTGKDRDAAFQVLHDHHRIKFVKFGKKTCYVLNPAVFREGG